jgi:hypothetical protein
MERAKSSVYEMLHAVDASAALTFEDRVNIALHLCKGLEVLLSKHVLCFVCNVFNDLIFTRCLSFYTLKMLCMATSRHSMLFTWKTQKHTNGATLASARKSRRFSRLQVQQQQLLPMQARDIGWHQKFLLIR